MAKSEHECSSPILKTEQGEVLIDGEAEQAILMVQDMAYSLGLSPSDFISVFDAGIPECPHCERSVN